MDKFNMDGIAYEVSEPITIQFELRIKMSEIKNFEQTMRNYERVPFMWKETRGVLRIIKYVIKPVEPNWLENREKHKGECKITITSVFE